MSHVGINLKRRFKTNVRQGSIRNQYPSVLFFSGLVMSDLSLVEKQFIKLKRRIVDFIRQMTPQQAVQLADKLKIKVPKLLRDFCEESKNK